MQEDDQFVLHLAVPGSAHLQRPLGGPEHNTPQQTLPGTRDVTTRHLGDVLRAAPWRRLQEVAVHQVATPESVAVQEAGVRHQDGLRKEKGNLCYLETECRIGTKIGGWSGPAILAVYSHV